MKLTGSQIRLFNLNTFDYSEEFKGMMIKIPAGEYIVMEYDEANQFMSKMNNPKRGKDGLFIPSTFKKLAMDPGDKKRAEAYLRDEKEEESKRIFVCHACNGEFQSKKELTKHVKESHMNELADQKTREAVEEMDS
jgi:uncharacterized C2H2 Zn-finger protein